MSTKLKLSESLESLAIWWLDLECGYPLEGLEFTYHERIANTHLNKISNQYDIRLSNIISNSDCAFYCLMEAEYQKDIEREEELSLIIARIK